MRRLVVLIPLALLGGLLAMGSALAALLLLTGGGLSAPRFAPA